VRSCCVLDIAALAIMIVIDYEHITFVRLVPCAASQPANAIISILMVQHVEVNTAPVTNLSRRSSQSLYT
jgi:hypothetical protein